MPIEGATIIVRSKRLAQLSFAERRQSYKQMQWFRLTMQEEKAAFDKDKTKASVTRRDGPVLEANCVPVIPVQTVPGAPKDQ